MHVRCWNANTLKTDNCSHIIPVPLCFQETVYTCGVACVQSILASYGIIYRQDILIEMLKQKPIFGTDYRNIIDFFEMLGFQVTFNQDMDIDTIKNYIDKGITPILMIQAWKQDNIDYNADWRDSHYVIACGYNEDNLIIMDPFTLGNYTYINNSELKERWHSLDWLGTHHLYTGLVVQNEKIKVIYKPHDIIHLD